MSVPAPKLPTHDRPVAITRALLSVSDKKDLVEFATGLHERGVELVSTGGTHAALANADLPVREVAELTEMPELMDGRVKTLHPKIHGGLLALRDDPDHAAAVVEHAIPLFDLLVVDLYPFEQMLEQGAVADVIIENIDIGGPAMIRAGAKNHGYTSVVVDIADYQLVLNTMDAHNGAMPFAVRRRLAAKAFGRTAAYDAAIAGWFAAESDAEMPHFYAAGGTKLFDLRYGENPHQEAGFYRSGHPRAGVATARQIQGKSLSYNNINDTDAAFELVSEFITPGQAAVAIIKHANPCGVACAASLAEAYAQALRCDPVSAFGGIVACNQVIDDVTADQITKVFTEVVIAPGVTASAQAIFDQRPNLRLLLTDALADVEQGGLLVKSVAGGLLVQHRDTAHVGQMTVNVVTRRAPTDQEMADLKFAFTVAKHVKSNAIVYVKDGATVGIGAGQMSRVDSCLIAAKKAADATAAAGLEVPLATGSVVASDAFFPFADGLMAAVEAGARAVIQPGGSMRDEEVIAAADAHDIAMVMTGIRHFRH